MTNNNTGSFSSVGVVGLGYVGLPLSLTFAEAGLHVVGFDIDPAKPEALLKGETYLKTIPAERIRPQVEAGRFTAATDFSRVAEVDALIYCVPTPLTHHREPDMTFIESTARATAPHIQKGMLVVLESTTYPGTTDEVVRPILEEGSGLTADRDFFLAYSPEREDPGNEQFTTSRIPKVVGADDDEARRRVIALYGAAFDRLVPVSSTRAAEMVKIYENTFRAVNIAMANEVKLLCERMGLDVFEIIDAASSKPFGFMPFYPGPGLGGHCIAGKETVHIRHDSLDTVVPISKLFDRLERAQGAYCVPGGTFLRPRNLETVTIDTETGAAAWRKVGYLFKRPYNGLMVRISFSGNYTLKTTDRHPMLVIENDVLVVREARNLKTGDRVPRYAGLSAVDRATEDPELDLLSLLPSEVLNKLHVRIQGTPWSNHERLLKSQFGWKIRDSIRKDSLSALRFLEIERAVDVSHDRLLLLMGRGNSHTTFPAVWKLTPDICRFLGYYLSEGCITWEKGNPRVRLTFNRDEREFISDCAGIMDTIGVRTSIHQDKTFHSTTLRIASSLLGWILAEVLRTGTDSGTMRIPSALMSASRLHHAQILAGLLRGDGDVYVTTGERAYEKKGRHYRHQFNSGTVGYFSSSPELFAQAESLLLGLGFRVTRKSAKPQLRMHTQDDIQRLARLLAGEKAERLKHLEASRIRSASARSTGDWAGGRCLTVKSVELKEDRRDVYSVEVMGTHTFATTGGIFVHNCIPIDPFYLTWKAREYDFPTKFIELAGEINTGMPYHVVDRLIKGLGAMGRPVKGAKILILGVAYKSDVDDLRESPALKIMSLLQKEGVRLAYHDPHISKIWTTREYDFDLESTPLTAEAVQSFDAVVITTAHKAVDYDLVAKTAKLILDTRNVYKHPLPNVIKA